MPVTLSGMKFENWSVNDLTQKSLPWIFWTSVCFLTLVQSANISLWLILRQGSYPPSFKCMSCSYLPWSGRVPRASPSCLLATSFLSSLLSSGVYASLQDRVWGLGTISILHGWQWKQWSVGIWRCCNRCSDWVIMPCPAFLSHWQGWPCDQRNFLIYISFLWPPPSSRWWLSEPTSELSFDCLVAVPATSILSS